MTLLEALVVLLIVSILVSFASLNVLAWLDREQQRSAVYGLYVHVSLARVEATNRNRPCRFTLDTSTRTIRVFDLHDTSTSSDDELIAEAALDPGVDFGLPDGSDPVTLASLSGTTYGTTFDADGSAVAGVGGIGLQSGETFRRISIYAGGGVAIERWNGSSWAAGA